MATAVIVESDDEDAILAAIIVEELASGLTARKAFILRRRHGLDGKERTLKEICQDLGITGERVRQIEAGVLDPTRRPAGAPTRWGQPVTAPPPHMRMAG